MSTNSSTLKRAVKTTQRRLSIHGHWPFILTARLRDTDTRIIQEILEKDFEAEKEAKKKKLSRTTNNFAHFSKSFILNDLIKCLSWHHLVKLNLTKTWNNLNVNSLDLAESTDAWRIRNTTYALPQSQIHSNTNATNTILYLCLRANTKIRSLMSHRLWWPSYSTFVHTASVETNSTMSLSWLDRAGKS